MTSNAGTFVFVQLPGRVSSGGRGALRARTDRVWPARTSRLRTLISGAPGVLAARSDTPPAQRGGVHDHEDRRHVRGAPGHGAGRVGPHGPGAWPTRPELDGTGLPARSVRPAGRRVALRPATGRAHTCGTASTRSRTSSASVRRPTRCRPRRPARRGRYRSTLPTCSIRAAAWAVPAPRHRWWTSEASSGWRSSRHEGIVG